jgi:Flp pilus assembly protein TadD
MISRSRRGAMRGSRLALAAGVVAALSCRRETPSAGRAPEPSAAPPAKAVFVGRAACEKCHAEEARRWKGSHHDLAMQEATEATVLGDFRGARFTHFGVTSTFFRKDGRFFVRTDGPDGKLQEYPIAYTFGIDPLQQYLIAFPGGRYQALNVVWDTRPKAEGGQRWFHLYPKEEVAHSDPLHWTGLYQNWNFMCAECHSTDVSKGYVAAEDRYETTFSEINVSCEACHGPGSAHVAWAEAVRGGKTPPVDPSRGLDVVFGDPVKGRWIIDPATGLAKRDPPRVSRAEVEACGRCHARRSAAAEYAYGRPLADTHRPVLLEAGLFRADGQIEDEVYEYQSFLQSRMYAKGVTCSDCHNPHDLRVAGSGDRVCAGCHAVEKFETPSHHFHKAGTPGASCLSCHMPTRNYMVVDARHDHSFRVPRPDLTVAIGVPNACANCHGNRPAKWAAEAALRWWGPKRRDEPHYGEAIHAGRETLAGAGPALAALAADPSKPGIVRGTALTLLPSAGAASPAALLEAAVRDGDPYVRRGAVAAAMALEPAARAAILSPLLSDPIRTVRQETARALAPLPPDAIAPADRGRLEAGLAEWVESQLLDADRAEAHVGLGALYAETGDPGRAETEYRTALRLLPAFGAASVNLADLYRQQGRDAEGERVLRQALSVSPRDPGVHHALGLALIRLRRLPEAVGQLRAAAELSPSDSRYAYVYGMALDATGDPSRALAVLEKASARHTGDRTLLEAIVAVGRRAGDAAASADALRRLESLRGP